MAQIPNLDNSPLDLKSIREQSQRELISILRNIRGKKCLVIDTNLSGSISLIIQTAILKDHGAELRLLGDDLITTDCNKIVYLVRSQFKLMSWICSHVQNDMSKGLQREYYLYFVPRREVACEKVLEDGKVHNLFTIGEYPLYSVPLDEDIISFELDTSCKELQVDGDTSSLWHIAKAIHKLEFSFGLIPNVRAKGKASVRVGDILSRLQMEDPVNANDVGFPGIDTVVLLDREVDMVTPMCTQLTYEGLIDEFLSIKNGCVEVDSSVMGGQQDGKKAKVPLNSSDKLFKEIRDLNFEVVIQVLRQKAVSMKQDYSEMSTTNQSVSELKDFVKKLNSLPEITRHINLAQHLSTFTSKPSFLSKLEMEHAIIDSEGYEECFESIETLIYKQEPLFNVLRLLVLFSLTNGGLPKKLFDPLRREILHSYGFEYAATLNSLEKAGLLKKQDAKSSWLRIKHALRLIVEDTNTFNPNDIAYVYSGYAPLSVRLVHHAINYGWRQIEDILRLMPGPHSDTKRAASPCTIPNEAATLQERVPDGRRSLVLVVFIGGVTLAEISALRFLTSVEPTPYDVIIATTKIVNGNSLMETFTDK